MICQACRQGDHDDCELAGCDCRCDDDEPEPEPIGDGDEDDDELGDPRDLDDDF